MNLSNPPSLDFVDNQPPAEEIFGRSIADELAAALGADRVIRPDAFEGRTFSDWSAMVAEPPVALVLPRSTREVAIALRVCHEHGWPLVVQGGLTGLTGGATVQRGEVALSLSRMQKIESIDSLGGIAVVEAGATLEALQSAVARHGWSFPLDLGARGSCQLGGNAATNAGGNRVLRYGTMRQLVRGLEVVLPDGTVIDMLDTVIKNNTGLDLKQLFIGTEGTLGVITRLALALAPSCPCHVTALCAVSSFDAAAQLLAQARLWLPELCAFEVMWREFLVASTRLQGRPLPLEGSHPLFVLLEVQGPDHVAATAAVESFLERCAEQGWIDDAIVAQSLAQSSDLWACREGVSELLSHLKPCATFDVSVALPLMDRFVRDLQETLSRHFPDCQHLFFGHLGDGNLHLISGPFATPQALEEAESMVYSAVGAARGSVSAEHGIGLLKRPFLHHSRSAAQIDLMRRIKDLIDPRQLLNRGRILAADSLGSNTKA